MGFGEAARRRQIRKYIIDEKLDGVGLQETIKEEFIPRELDEISSGFPFRWV
jgi:hypothetical protein